MAATKQRRAKPTNFGVRRSFRLSGAEEDAIAAMREALARVRGVPTEKVSFAEALRLLLTENEKAARALAGQPEKLVASAGRIDVPDDLWNRLTDCQNRLSHSQGSLYTVMRKLNFDEGVTREEVRTAFDAVQESKAAVERMEERLLEFIESQED